RERQLSLPGRADAGAASGVAERTEEGILERQGVPGLSAQAAMHESRQALDRAQLLRGGERGDAPKGEKRPRLDEAQDEPGRASVRNDEGDDGLSTVPAAGIDQSQGGVRSGGAGLQS